MRVVLLTADYPPNVGGIATHVQRLAGALGQLGHAVEVWWWKPQETAEAVYSDDHGVTVRVVTGHSGFRRMRSVLDARPLARQLDQCMSEFGPDVIHVHTMGPLLRAGRMLRRGNPGIRLVFTNHSSGYLKALETGHGRMMLRATLFGADAVIAPSRELQHKSKFIHPRSAEPVYIPNGVTVSDFETSTHADPARPTLLTTRRFVEKNGLRYLIEAMPRVIEKHPSVELLMAGSRVDGEWEHISSRLRTLGLTRHVRMLGAVPNHDVAKLLHSASLVIVPSLMEATSISILEAMAAGKPIVASNVGGIPELLTHGETGLLVPARDPDALADALLLALAQPRYAAQLGMNARSLAASEFDWEAIATKTVEVYDALSASSASSNGA